MAFHSLPPPLVKKRCSHAFPVTCSRRDYRRSSIPPLFSAAVAVAISLPLVTGEREGPQPSYRKLAPVAATAVVATSLMLKRRQESSRAVVPKQSPHMESIETPLHGDRQNTALGSGRTNSSIYNGSREDWSTSEPPYDPSHTSRGSTDSYPGHSYFDAKNPALDGIDNNEAMGGQPAVGMDTTSLFSHMRAEFDSEPSKDREDSEPQGCSSHQGGEDRHQSLVRPPVSNLPGRDKSGISGLQHPSSISAADVLRWILRAPVFILSDIVVPIAQVSSIMWYDGKQWILGLRNQEEKLYFIDDTQPSEQGFNSFDNNSETPWDWDDMDVELTDEERLLNEIQSNMRTAVGHAYGTVRRFFG
ncbi:hypothetical protein FGB62_165g02 [Gracilaria domingensis]|nr:hypothetical protein FGB62_165g02 [Gracilaria domingensis]